MMFRLSKQRCTQTGVPESTPVSNNNNNDQFIFMHLKAHDVKQSRTITSTLNKSRHKDLQMYIGRSRRDLKVFESSKSFNVSPPMFTRSRIRSHKFPIVARAGYGVKNYRIIVVFVQNLP